MSTFRLDKYLADAGIGTRSEIKNYIKKGYVTVNGEPTKKPDIKISPDDDEIVFQNQPISLSEFEYYLLNKPAGYVSATKDNTAPTVLTLIDSKRKDLFPVGRLDKDTEGLLIITNDGALSHRLLSPKRHVDKTYFAIVDGIVTKADVTLFEKGLEIGDDDLDIAMPAQLIIEKIDPEQNISHVTITIQEGKFHQVKRMFQAVEKKVLYLKRIAFGPIALPHDLPLGDSRILSKEEISMLQKF
ncbi:MAG: rRNA pseudouridine synthase [Lachnospiraceae bacterium]|nr:rRNA pseudouridine synthase [Lachnospiraceae bacterium]